MIVALPIQIGILRPATMKFVVESAFFDAKMPMDSMITRYMATPMKIIVSVLNGNLCIYGRPALAASR